jgi:drug/metabolite transporter (DMT)-like permease
MTSMELGLCMSSVLSSSISQLFIKSASARGPLGRAVILLGIGATLLICSVLLVVVALRTMNLSQLVSFAAFAYVLVPLGGHFVFGERLLPRFWLGSFLIVAGILCANF